jgi:hypothetical protein
MKGNKDSRRYCFVRLFGRRESSQVEFFAERNEKSVALECALPQCDEVGKGWARKSVSSSNASAAFLRFGKRTGSHGLDRAYRCRAKAHY